LRPSERAVLAIDLGTTEAKAGIVGLDGRLHALGRSGYPLELGEGTGRAEQDPEAWWRAVLEAAATALAENRREIVAIGIDGQGPTCVAVDDAGAPTRPAIGWLDSRAANEAVELADRTGIDGWRLANWPMALWIERHDEAAARRTRWYLETWEWLGLRLTGKAAKTVASAGRSPTTQDLGSAGIPEGSIAPSLPAGKVLGGLQHPPAMVLGLPAGLPVVAGLVDAFASIHGAGLLVPGDAIDTGGTSGGFGVYVSRPEDVPVASAPQPAPLSGLWLAGGAMSATGKALDWFREDILRGTVGAAELIAEAAATPPGADGLVFLPYLAGERAPIYDPAARGAFAGLALGHGRGHLARAILEAAALAIRHVATPMIEAGVVVSEMRVTGGTARNEVLNQIKADVTGFTVAIPAIPETAVVGSAILAATAIGTYPDIRAAIREMARVARRLEPRTDHRMTYDSLFEAYVDLYPRLAPTFRQLQDFARFQVPDTGAAVPATVSR
jgi:xylulokinase